jgi:hypothetical protein
MDPNLLCRSSALSRYVHSEIWVVAILVVGCGLENCNQTWTTSSHSPIHSSTHSHTFINSISTISHSFTHTTNNNYKQQQTERADRLNIQFYEATYNPSFASIFATVDICAIVPKEHAHVCILEEPEHLNWMRVVQDDVDEGETLSEQDDGNPQEMEPTTATDTTTITSTTTTSTIAMTTSDVVEMNQLGWQAKFDFVVGILHTNYDAYVRQYGMGAAFLAASALHALSSLCTRAYCHRVIRLSETLPALDASKEVTCNVHGVLTEFLQDPTSPPTTGSDNTSPPNELSQDTKNDDDNDDPALASIYFIGKLVRVEEVKGSRLPVLPLSRCWLADSTVLIQSFIVVFVQCLFFCRYVDLGQGV